MALFKIPKKTADKPAKATSSLAPGAKSFDLARLPVIGSMSFERRHALLTALLFGFSVLTTALVGWYLWQVNLHSSQVETATRLQMLSQRYAKTAQEAVLGNSNAFTQLEASRQSFAEGLNALGGNAASLQELRSRWQTSKKNIEALLAQQAALVSLGESIRQINAGNAEILGLVEGLEGLIPASAGRYAALVRDQAVWIQRMARNANTLVSGTRVDPQVAYQLGEDAKSFREAIDALAEGDPEMGIMAIEEPAIREKVLALQSAFALYEGYVHPILKGMPQLLEAKRAGRAIFDESEPLLALTENLTQAYRQEMTALPMTLAALSGVMALLSLLLLSRANIAEARQRAEQAAEEKEAAARENLRNQDAILRLLNEMGDLAEGDLSARATVTEDITGAIADSVNMAIEELRTLVGNVNRAAEEVTHATDTAKQLSDDMLNTAAQQAKDVETTTASITRMAQSVQQVSQNAADSARVAEQSLDSAKRGGDSVRNAISGMNSIREQIQETSKRIKRLGESSQEIGEILELISDITEQTNVLALNAAIQAAAAGEAGRGFTVVAEEVQRLAERSGQATRRIGALVKTIQGDTQDAVHAMELSTQGVVEGTALSDAAGHALQDIESVSGELAGLIQRISDATRDQASTAAKVADTMGKILTETRQTAQYAQLSAQSIGELTVLSDDLRVSVSGFKL